MQLRLPKEVVAIVSIMHHAGYEMYVVGGAIRDTLIGRETHDWDFTTNALPEQIQEQFPDSFYENTFGTVGVAREHLWTRLTAHPIEFSKPDNFVYEVTTYRSEQEYADFRRPTSVEWGKSISEDLQRRDFTINAIALSIAPDFLATYSLDDFSHQDEWMEVPGELVDPYDGQSDLRQQRIQAVGDPNDRFQEDALRMLRAVRLAAQLSFTLDTQVLIALQKHASLITNISWERIRDEFLKILVSANVEDSFAILYSTGLLQHILPELIETRGVDQRGHHEHDVWTHSLRACQLCPSPDPIVKFAALLHDIAKPQTQEPIPESNGEYSFHNHEVIGARVARDIARRFRFSNHDVQRVFTLVRWHMFHYQPSMTDSAIRRFIRRVGVENIDQMLHLREGDRLGSGSKRTSWRLEEMKERIDAELHQPMQVKDMAISGEDVMRELDIEPGPEVGRILNTLFEEVFEDPTLNDREKLLSKLKDFRNTV